MLSPESFLLVHRAAHAELLAELAAGRRGGRRRASAGRVALRRVGDAIGRAVAGRGPAARPAGPVDQAACVACA